MTTEQQTEWPCPERGCERTFSLERGLKRHLAETHGYPRSKSAAAKASERQRRQGLAAPELNGSGVLEGLEEVTAPLQAEVQRLEDELAELDRQRESISFRLRPLRTALNTLSKPAAKPGPKGPRSSNGKAGPIAEAKIAEVLAFINEHGEDEYLAEGFTGKRFQEHFRANGGKAHESTIRLALLTLHERGQLRLLRRTVGGGRLYTPTKQANDAAFSGGEQ